MSRTVFTVLPLLFALLYVLLGEFILQSAMMIIIPMLITISIKKGIIFMLLILNYPNIMLR